MRSEDAVDLNPSIINSWLSPLRAGSLATAPLMSWGLLTRQKIIAIHGMCEKGKAPITGTESPSQRPNQRQALCRLQTFEKSHRSKVTLPTSAGFTLYD